MMIQEEFTRHLVSMTSQTLSTTIAMAHSFFFWVSSSTPAVSEGFQAAATLMGATPSWLVQLFAAAGDKEGQPESTSTAGQDSVEYYYNTIHAVILLLVVLFYFKIVSAVWRSVSAVWKTTVGVYQILGFVATKMRGLVRCLLRGRQDSANGPPALDPSSVPACANDNVHTNAPSHLAPPPQPPLALPPHGGLWYYYDPATQTLVPWIPPPLPLPPLFFPPVPAMGGVPPPPPPPSRVGRQAQAPLPPPPMPPQESLFCPIPEAEAGRERNNDNNHSDAGNKKDGRMVNVDRQELAPPPLFGSPRADKKKNDGVTTHVVGTLDKTGAMSNRTILHDTAVNYEADPAIGAPTIAAAATATDVAAKDASAAKKRKSPPCDGNESDNAKQVGMDHDPLLADLAAEDVCHRQHSKKQKLQKAKENAKAWADKTFASTNN